MSQLDRTQYETASLVRDILLLLPSPPRSLSLSLALCLPALDCLSTSVNSPVLLGLVSSSARAIEHANVVFVL